MMMMMNNSKELTRKSIYIRQVNDYPISFVLFVLHCEFNNQHNGKTKVAFD